jgi:hypothetical protein
MWIALSLYRGIVDKGGVSI